jgi:hypothetical protein
MKSFIRRNVTTLLLFILVIVIGIVLTPGIGAAWDEPDNMFAGGVYWNFFTQGLNPAILNNSSSNFNNQVYPLDRYISHLPPVYNYIGTAFAIGAERLGAPKLGKTVIASYHIMTVLFFGLLVATTYNFGILLGLGPWWSLVAALATFLYPTLFGHGLSDSKDTAQAALFTLSLYLLVKGSRYKIRHDIVLGAFAWGLGLATKFNAIYVPIIWGIWVQCQMLNAKWPIKKNLSYIFRFIIGHLSLVIAVGFATAFIVWPYLWFNTIHHAMEVVQYFTNVGRGYAFFWEGQRYQSGLGVSYWWYPLGSFLLGTPIPLFLCMTIGAIRVIRGYKKHPERIILIIWIVIPFLRAFWPWASLYDQLRHFVETVPAFAIMAAVALQTFAQSRFRTLAYIIGMGIVVHLVVINAIYFPYSAGYLNILASDPNKNFDRDVEALSVKEGVDYLHHTFGAVNVWAPIGGHLSWYYLTDGDHYAYNSSDADSIILINKSSHIREDEFYPMISDSYKLTYTISRGGAIFAWIYRKH